MTNKKFSHKFDVELNNEQLTAVEAWRSAKSIQTTQEAIQDLVQLGLLSEIRHIYMNAVSKNAPPKKESYASTMGDNDD